MTLRYVTTDENGWLRVKLEPAKTVISVHEYLKVAFDRHEAGRDYFKILEGTHKDALASVSAKADNSSWLASPLPEYKTACLLKFKRSEKLLITPVGIFKAITAESNRIPLGVHPIQLPDFPHKGGRSYITESSKALTWFYLGRGKAVKGNNDRYLHPGTVTAGCVTVTDLAKWNTIYSYLILCRKNDRSVGDLLVVD